MPQQNWYRIAETIIHRQIEDVQWKDTQIQTKDAQWKDTIKLVPDWRRKPADNWTCSLAKHLHRVGVLLRTDQHLIMDSTRLNAKK